jgi:hypothetical protein
VLVAELPARSGDISPSACADVAVHAVLAEHTLEQVHIVAAGAFEGEPFNLVVPDQVDIGPELLGDSRQFLGVLGQSLTPESRMYSRVISRPVLRNQVEQASTS